MKRCPQCQGACWDAHKHCPACGANVEDVEITEGDPLIGVTVGGKFVLREVLGEGAMGKVYRADQTNLGRTRAPLCEGMPLPSAYATTSRGQASLKGASTSGFALFRCRHRACRADGHL